MKPSVAIKDLDPILRGDYVSNVSQNRVYFDHESIPLEIKGYPELKYFELVQALDAPGGLAAYTSDGSYTYGSFLKPFIRLQKGYAANQRVGMEIRVKRVEFSTIGIAQLLLDRQPKVGDQPESVFPASTDFYNARYAAAGPYLRNMFNIHRFELIAPQALNQQLVVPEDPFGNATNVVVDMDLPVRFIDSNPYYATNGIPSTNDLLLHLNFVGGGGTTPPAFIRIYFTDV